MAEPGQPQDGPADAHAHGPDGHEEGGHHFQQEADGQRPGSQEEQPEGGHSHAAHAPRPAKSSSRRLLHSQLAQIVGAQVVSQCEAILDEEDDGGQVPPEAERLVPALALLAEQLRSAGKEPEALAMAQRAARAAERVYGAGSPQADRYEQMYQRMRSELGGDSAPSRPITRSKSIRAASPPPGRRGSRTDLLGAPAPEPADVASRTVRNVSVYQKVNKHIERPAASEYMKKVAADSSSLTSQLAASPGPGTPTSQGPRQPRPLTVTAGGEDQSYSRASTPTTQGPPSPLLLHSPSGVSRRGAGGSQSPSTTPKVDGCPSTGPGSVCSSPSGQQGRPEWNHPVAKKPSRLTPVAPEPAEPVETPNRGTLYSPASSRRGSLLGPQATTPGRGSAPQSASPLRGVGLSH